MCGGEVRTANTERVRETVETAADSFEAETDWGLGIGGTTPPPPLGIARDLPKRGPARLRSRLALQTAKGRFPF